MAKELKKLIAYEKPRLYSMNTREKLNLKCAIGSFASADTTECVDGESVKYAYCSTGMVATGGSTSCGSGYENSNGYNSCGNGSAVDGDAGCVDGSVPYNPDSCGFGFEVPF